MTDKDEYFSDEYLSDEYFSEDDEQVDQDELYKEFIMETYLKNGNTLGVDGYVYDAFGNKTTLFFPRLKQKEQIIEQKIEISTKPAPWANLQPQKVNLRDIMKETSEYKAPELSKSVIVRKDLVDVNKKKPQQRVKWCTNMTSYGVCRRKDCMFAHNEDEFEFGNCRRRHCVMRDCIYKHTWESLDEFKSRTHFVVPEKIKRNMYLKK